MDDEVSKIIDDLFFEKSKTIKEDAKNGQYFLIGQIKGRDVFLKISNKKNKSRINQLEKEKTVDKILDKHNKNIAKPLVVKTDIFGFGDTPNYIWIARKFYPGQSLASFDQNRSLFGYDILRRNFLLQRNKIMDKIIYNLEAIDSLETDFRKLGLKHNDFKRRYPNDIEDYDINSIEEELNISLSRQIEFYNKVKKNYLEKNNIRASVGDLSPANIIVKKDGELIFSDFELFSFDNYTVDIAYLYLFLWRYKKWQSRLIELAIKNDNSRVFFVASAIRILMYLYMWPYMSLNSNRKKITDSKEFNRKHIWRKYLEAAGESFDAIMKVK